MMQAVNGRPVTYGRPIQVRAFTFLKRPVELSTGQQFDAWVYQDEDGVKRAPRWVRFALDDAHNKYTRRIAALLEDHQAGAQQEDPVEAAERRARREQAQNEAERAFSDYLTDVALLLIEGIDETTANSIDSPELDALFTELGYFKHDPNQLQAVAQEDASADSEQGDKQAADPLSGATSQPDSPQPTLVATT